MRLYYIFSLMVLLFLSNCQNEKQADKNNSRLEQQPLQAKESDKTLDVPWNAVYNDSTQLLEIKKNPVAHPGNLSEQDIIDALNLKYPQIKIEAVLREGNKAIVKIKDATYLTEELGSTGAQAFLAEATYSLTEVEGIEAVEFRFEPGDHATPGIFTRSSFENFN